MFGSFRDNLRILILFLGIGLCLCSLHETIFQTSKLTANAEIHLFKAGVEPKWEDPECANGGKWTWVVTNNRKEALDKGWLETV